MLMTPGAGYFIQNAGQFDPAALFVLENSRSRLWLAKDGLWLTLVSGRHGNGEELSGVNLQISFPGADPKALLQPQGRLQTQINYLNGIDKRSAATWNSVVYSGLYPGVDLLIEPASSGSELFSWRLVAQPTADLSRVRLSLAGADSVQITQEHILATTSLGVVALPLFQVDGAESINIAPIKSIQASQKPIEIAAPLRHAGLPQSAAFQAAGSLAYSSFLGGSAWEAGYGIALGQDGSVYVAGRTASTNFPTTSGAFDRRAAQVDAFIAKLDPTTGDLIYATVLGGKGADAAYAIALAGDQAYVTGETQSPDFPTAGAALDQTCGSEGTCDAASAGPISDAFLAQISADGSRLVYSTFLGGKDEDSGYGVAVEGQQVYLTGITYSADFPATGYKANGDAFVASFDSAHKLTYASLLGGSDIDAGFAIAVQGGEAVITGETFSPDFPAQTYQGGRDLMLARLDATGALVHAVLVGGGGDERGNSIALDNGGNAAVAGWSNTPDLPVTSGAYAGNGDALLLLVNSQGNVSQLAYFGGTNFDEGRGIAFSESGSQWMTGFTTSSDFPVTSQAFQASPGGSGDAFLAQLDASAGASAQLLYSSYLGGSGEDSAQALAYLPASPVYVTGYSSSSDYPLTAESLTTNLNGSQDAFITGLNPTGSPGPIPTVPTPTQTSVPPTATPAPQDAPGTATPTTGLPAVSGTTTDGSLASPLPGETQSPPGSAPQDTPGAGEAATTLQANPTTGQSTDASAAGSSVSTPGADDSPSQPEASQNIGWIWLVILAVLAGIGVVVWMSYQRSHRN
jgi:hypothetical protein